MSIIIFSFRLINKLLVIAFLILICTAVLFINYKGNQPMHVPEAPKGMTYFQFMSNRLDAAKTVKPARCGSGMIGSLFALGPFYATLYTHVAIHPDGFLAKVTAPDPDMPKNLANLSWFDVPSIWWDTFERLSWTMLARRHPGCSFKPVLAQKTH